ncbi:phage portal protein [Candidatus Pacearchaeota archaeon]|nr:phage portal protein [Candidatus Pacearchaeota archaeon]
MAKKAKTKEAKGRAFLYVNNKLVPVEKLNQYGVKISKDSSQAEKKSAGQLNKGLIPYPYPPENFLQMYESNPIFARCVKQIAIDVTGLGWNINLKSGKKESQTELGRINDFLKNPNKNESFRSILKKIMIDWGVVGWFGIEVVRSRNDEISEVYQIPAHTFKIHKSRNKFMQQRGQSFTWFKKYEYEKQVNKKDGKESSSLAVRSRANELIYYMNHYPLSSFYGAPDILPATGDMMGLFGQRDYNLAFFANYGVPSAIITLTGEWEDNSEDTISKFLNDQFKGPENQHRTLVLTQPDKCGFVYKPLGAEVKEGSFKLYEKERKENVLTAYSMPPERVGIRIVGKLGGNVAEEATRIYVQGVVEPLQLDMEDIINDKILQSETYTFKFKNVDLRDFDALVQQLGYQIERGMTSPNEARKELGRQGYEGGEKLFIGTSLIETGETEEELEE